MAVAKMILGRPRIMKFLRETVMKRGLILEGGAMRGMFTCGVIDEFLEAGISFEGMVGVSAGAVFGCNFKSRQIGRAIRYNKMYCREKQYASWSNVLKTGDLFGVDFCYRRIPFELDLWDDKTFRENPMELYTVATNIETGEPDYHLCDEGMDVDIKYMQASASMPVVSNTVEIDGKKLVDGGVSDSVPIRFFEEQGYDRNVIILTQPKGYVKEKNSMMPLIKLKYRKYPKLVEAMANRHIVYNETTAYIEKLEAEGKALVIRPEKALGIGHITKNPAELERVYQLGRTAGRQQLESVKAFLSTDVVSDTNL